ncbi:multicopper oxidase-domain-containing protein [Thelonectria olida]|uniref:Multicopper oxidase-domain-containing protein n=1 Tax=Thelonectria olida TaxID=1576542 RepID=A0A9P8VYM1_9HYPO|nr:multicopper oxidase-domain-containing protein [Thelonectria olida]
MTLLGRFWHAVVDLTTWLTLSPVHPWQHPLGEPITHGIDQTTRPHGDYPVFRPPAGNPGDHDFKCEYPEMEGWEQCSISENRECWLRNKDGQEFNIHTNYEKFAPKGITRHYTLNVTESSFNADGQPFTDAKLFNETYPGPWLEACWGDTLNITIVNKMHDNGTSIHWHGIRQNLTMDMDGVNGITQCPIAPGQSFSYVFKATQYGTSWYHSHYSVQYADGLQGPLTIHGPSSAPFDASKRPLLMTDWSHNSAYQLLYNNTWGNKTILLNGRGNVSHYGYTPSLEVPDQYELHFNKTPTDKPTRPKRYLLRLINTSFDSTFVFSIDNHWLQIVTADFVPIEPYYGTSVLIGIGQRYNVIVEANPLAGDSNPIPDDGNFWIRTWIADRCGIKPGGQGYEQTGILRYDQDSTATPTSQPWTKIRKACSDEEYTSLRPKIPWYVGPAANANYNDNGEQFNVTLNTTARNTSEFAHYPLAAFSLQRSSDGPFDFMPLQINYSDPIVMHLDETRDKWPSKWVVIPEDYTENEWVYLVLTMEAGSSRTGAHPIHLHGHDFAILQQAEGQEYDPSKINLKLDNPPRRDVVLLPNGGFVVIAFKADNPGSWLMHCHIARHASEGLALQIMERQSDANKLFPANSPNMIEANRVCDEWRTWQHNQKDFFQDDSGI